MGLDGPQITRIRHEAVDMVHPGEVGLASRHSEAVPLLQADMAMTTAGR